MKTISPEIIRFLKSHSFALVSTVDKRGRPNTSPKGIVEIEEGGYVYLMDLYHGRTRRNLQCNPHISVIAIDEERFRGWQLRGTAEIVTAGPEFEAHLPAWERLSIRRTTDRLLRNIGKGVKTPHHFEVHFPTPKYLIKVKVDEIIDLAPRPGKWKVGEKKSSNSTD